MVCMPRYMHIVYSLFCLLLFYAMATVFRLYHGGDMMYEMKRRKPESTLLLTQGIFNPTHHIGMLGTMRGTGF